MKFSRDAAIPRIPAPHLLKQGQLQLAGASFRDKKARALFSSRQQFLLSCEVESAFLAGSGTSTEQKLAKATDWERWS